MNDIKAKGFDYNHADLEYELVFEDNFEGDSLNLDNWGFDIGGHGWGNEELQYYTEGANVTVKDGHMTIEARKENCEGMEYTSCRLVTRNKHDILYGKVEVRAKVPSALGAWPAIWMLPTDWEYGHWPESGEVDIMEHVGYRKEIIHASVHTGAYNHRIGTEKTVVTLSKNKVADNFNTYFIEWLPDAIYFGVNDEVYNIYRPTDYVENPTFMEWPFDKRMHLLLNVAVGGLWGGAEGLNEEEFPQRMTVDSVKFYQSKTFNHLQNK